MKNREILMVSVCLLLYACEPALQQPPTSTSPPVTPTPATLPADAALPADYDQRLRDSIQQILQQHPDLTATNISVAVVDGAVILGGEVRSQAQIALAMQLTQNTPGVAAVSNEILVKQP